MLERIGEGWYARVVVSLDMSLRIVSYGRSLGKEGNYQERWKQNRSYNRTGTTRDECGHQSNAHVQCNPSGRSGRWCTG